MQAGRLYDVKFHTRDETSKDEKQLINLLQNKWSIFQTVVAFVVQKTGSIYLVLVGLMACWQSGRPAGR